VVTVFIAYIIYRVQKKEAVEHLQKHESRFDKLEQMHQQDSEKIKVLYELILKSQSGNVGELESAVLEQKIEVAAEQITNQDSDKAQALKAIAEKDKEEADDLLDKIAQREHDLVEVYALRAINEYRHGEYTEAIKWYQKILELEPENFDAFINLIKSLDGADRKKEALELAFHKLEALEKEAAGIDQRTYRLLKMIALCYDFESEAEEATPWVFRLLEVAKQLFGEQSREMGYVYNDLGNLYLQKQMYKESEENYLKSLHILENAGKEALTGVGTTLNNLALLYCHMGRYPEALPLMERSIQITDTALGEGHPESIYPLINYAYANARSGNHEEAVRRYLLVKDLIIRKVGKDHDMYFKVMQHLAGLYMEMKRNADAEAALRENLELQTARKGENCFEVAVLLRGLAQLLVSREENEEAEQLVRRSVDIFQRIGAQDGVQAHNARSFLVRLNIKRGNYDEAKQDLQQMIEYLSSQGRDANRNLAGMHMLLLELYVKQEQWAEAEQILTGVLPIYAAIPETQDYYIRFLRKNAEILTKLGRQAEAEEFKARLAEVNAKLDQEKKS